jgi:two-component system response regulator DesR
VIRVLLAEDQALLREALAEILRREEGLEVVAVCADGLDALAEAVRTRPDVAVLDVEMPGITGITLTERLATEVPECRVLILTVFARPGYVRRAMQAGAAGFILKDTPPAELAAAIRRTAAGVVSVTPDLAASALQQGECPLTKRELQVLAMSREVRATSDLARHLHLSEGTVRNHLSSAIQKLDARSRTEAARICEDRGWF